MSPCRRGKSTRSFSAPKDCRIDTATASQISQEYGIHQNVLQRWKKKLLEAGPDLFEDQRQKKSLNDPSVDLERKIGQLTMEIDFLKKVLGQ